MRGLRCGLRYWMIRLGLWGVGLLGISDEARVGIFGEMSQLSELLAGFLYQRRVFFGD